MVSHAEDGHVAGTVGLRRPAQIRPYHADFRETQGRTQGGLEERRCVDGMPAKPQFSVAQFKSKYHLLSNSDGL